MVGVGEGVNVIVGTGEGVVVETVRRGGGRVGGSKAGAAGRHAAISTVKTSEAVLWTNRQMLCFM